MSFKEELQSLTQIAQERIEKRKEEDVRSFISNLKEMMRTAASRDGVNSFSFVSYNSTYYHPLFQEFLESLKEDGFEVELIDEKRGDVTIGFYCILRWE